jgi:hexosaminidase
MNFYRMISIMGLILLPAVLSCTVESSRAAIATRDSLHLMPMPAEIKTADGKLVIDGNFSIASTGYEEPRLISALGRFVKRLERRTGIPMPAPIPGDPAKATVVIHCEAAGEAIQSVKENESYVLEVKPQQAHLIAPTPVGILHGLETLLQLVDSDNESFGFPIIKISDKPRFPWRGLMLDPCRHWMPIEMIKRNIDGMAAMKLNVLHWHLSEDQGFRVESKVFPKLHGMGSDGKYFTQDQVREVIAYARERGIRVVPEFDMPGHTTAWFVGYPELASAPGPYQIERHWGVFDPCMDPSKEELYTFLDAFIGEMSKLFPDEYFHIGGDEVNGKHWTASPTIQAFKQKNSLKDNHEFHVYFNKRLSAIVTKYDKKMIGWDEILHPDLPKNIVVQSWRGQASLADAAKKGYTGILSFGYYLDHILSASNHYQVDPLDKEAANLSGEEKSRILGGEACMWAEYVTPENVDSRIWPRMAAIAERLWSPQGIKDADDMYRRLEFVSRDLEALGLTHRSSYPSMLQRIAGDHSIDPVRVLSDVLEPVKYYTRGGTREYTSFTPLNRLVDATRPESDTARRFAHDVDQALASKSEMQTLAPSLRGQLIAWRDNHARLKPILDDSFLLKEAAPLSETLSALAKAGLQALDCIESGKTADDSWIASQKALFEQPRRPQTEVLIMIAPAINRLVQATAPKR